jgi:hypothetical protein
MINFDEKKVLTRPSATDKGKGKEVIIGDARKADENNKKSCRKVVIERTPDGGETLKVTITTSVTPGFKGTKPGASHTCAKKTTYIITECIEINVIKHQSTEYIAEVLLQNKIIKIKRTKDRRRQCRPRHAT